MCIRDRLKSLKISSEVKNIDQMEKVFIKNHNYKISNSKINKINYLGTKIFENNVKEIKNYLLFYHASRNYPFLQPLMGFVPHGLLKIHQ